MKFLKQLFFKHSFVIFFNKNKNFILLRNNSIVLKKKRVKKFPIFVS
jgi:hypothetical protein